MTYEELNEVWALKKAITKKQQKIAALRESAEIITPEYTQLPKGKNVDSRIEVLTALIVDEEAEISKLQERLIEAVPELTKKIQAAIIGDSEQTLMIYRYVACKYFRDIGFLMGYSERRVYQVHEQILRNISIRFS